MATLNTIIQVSGTETLSPQGTAVTSALATASISQVIVPTINQQLTNGTSTGNANFLIFQQRTLTAASTENLNLEDGSLYDVAGRTVEAASVRFFYAGVNTNASGTTASTSMKVGGAAANTCSLWFDNASDKAIVAGVNAIPFMQGNTATATTVNATNANVLIQNADASNVPTYTLVVAGVRQ